MDRLRFAPVAACLSGAVGFATLAGALSMSPWFVWTEDALSDLGHPRHPSALVFGAGLATAGALYVVFVWALAPATPRNALGTAGLLALAAGGLSLAAVGVVNESFGRPHLVVSVMYFAFVPVGMLLLALSMGPAQPRFRAATAAMSVAAGAVGLCVAGAQEYGWPFPSQAIPELIASLMLGAWSVVAAFWVARHGLGAGGPAATPPRHPSP